MSRYIRVPSVGTMWRLRSLVAMGHSPARIARALGVDPETISRLISADAERVSTWLYGEVIGLFEAWWDKRPPARNRWEKAAATKARARAAVKNWPCPAGLDEDQIEIPGYVPAHGWRYGHGTGVADDFPLGIRREASLCTSA